MTTKNCLTLACAAVSILNSISANAATDFSLFGADVSLSGFATAGFAISDQSYRYQRFINNDGTFKRDSLVGAQVDIKLNDEFSITAQAKVAPSLESDKEINPILTWAFLSWRPTNDLLFRGGRIRIPMYLNSQNMDIGATFDFARLPSEVYLTSPTNDIDGLSGSKTWNFDLGELTAEGYVGTTDTFSRLGSYNYPPLSGGTLFVPLKINLYGMALTFQHEESLFRVGVHDTYSQRTDGRYMIVDYPYVPISSKAGYYQVSNDALAGPGIPLKSQLHSFLYTVGADVSLGNGFRLMGEYVRREVRDILIGPDSAGEYLALLKSFGDWTPYVSMAHLQSTNRVLDFYNKLNNNRVPATVPYSSAINASQRAAANRTLAYDQTTWALGTSYQLNPTSKLKAEWAITQTGNVSSFIEIPMNGSSSNQLINVFSFSYNVTF